MAGAGAGQPLDRRLRRRPARAQELAGRRVPVVPGRRGGVGRHRRDADRRPSSGALPRCRLAGASRAGHGAARTSRTQCCTSAPARRSSSGTPSDGARWRRRSRSRVSSRYGRQDAARKRSSPPATARVAIAASPARSRSAQLWHLVAGASLLVAPDTGVAHLGRVVGTPTVALFGPGSATISGAGEFWRDAPYRAVTVTPFACRDQRVLFKRELDWVRRCGRTLAQCPHPRCMDAIDSDAVHGRDRRASRRDRLTVARRRLARPTIVQFNTSPSLGGAEVYTASFSRALAERGWHTRVMVESGGVVLERSGFRRGRARALHVGGCRDAGGRSGAGPRAAAARRDRRAVAASADRRRAPGDLRRLAPGVLRSGRNAARGVAARHRLACRARGSTRVHPTPLLGVADLARIVEPAPLRQGPLFEADLRKPRDRLMAAFARARAAFSPPRVFERRTGLTLGVVSRLAPLKQFPGAVRAARAGAAAAPGRQRRALRRGRSDTNRWRRFADRSRRSGRGCASGAISATSAPLTRAIDYPADRTCPSARRLDSTCWRPAWRARRCSPSPRRRSPRRSSTA